MSYNGRLGFGLLGDFDALPDIDDGRRRAARRDRGAARGVRDGQARAPPPRAAKPKPAAPSEPRPA